MRYDGGVEGVGTRRMASFSQRANGSGATPGRASLDSTSKHLESLREIVVVDGFSQSWRATIAWSWAAVSTYLVLVALLIVYMPTEPAALLRLRAEVPILVYEASVSAFFTAMCLNLTSFLFETSSAKRQLALLCTIIKGIAAVADWLTVLGLSGVYLGQDGILINPSRTAQWLVTTPTMVFILSKITSLSNTEITATIVVDLIMVVGGFVACGSPYPFDLIYFGMATVGFAYVMWMMARMTWSAMREHDTPMARRSLRVTLYGTWFCWSLFPVAWLLPRLVPGTGLLVPELINVAANFLSKVLLSSSMIHGNYIAIAEKDKQEVQKHISAMVDSLSVLHGEHARLKRNQEVLQAELDCALRNYTPLAIIDEGTPADKMLQVISSILTGEDPTLDDVMYVRNAIMDSKDIYMPINLTSQLQTSQLDEDVSHQLLTSLMGRQRGVATESTAADGLPISSLSRTLTLRGSQEGRASGRDDDHDQQWLEDGNGSFASLQAALACILGTKLPGAEALAAAAAKAKADAAVATFLGLKGEAHALAEVHAVMSEGDLAALCEDGGAAEASKVDEAQVKVLPVFRRRGSARTSLGGSNNMLGVLLESLAGEDEGDETAIAAPGPCLVLEVERVLLSVRFWQFDAFALHEASQGHPLSTLAYFLFHESGLINHFDIQGAVLARFLRTIEEGYADNPYHNRSHAADVLQSMHVLLHGGGLVPGYADPLTLMACYLAAIVHDYEHVGKTNDFLIGSNDELALRYNDRAPLENHHLSAAFKVLRDPNCNFLKHLQRGDMDRLRKTMIELVLGTDMKQHFAIISQFNTLHRGAGSANIIPPSPAGGAVRRRSESAADANGGLTASDLSYDGNGEVRMRTPTDEAERMLALQMALKCADLGHIAAKLVVHLKWVGRLQAEFFAQGDCEKELGMPISPLFDRTKPGVSKSQIGFFDVVTIPLFRSFTGVFTGAKPMLTYVLRNYQYWEVKSH